MEHVWYDIWDDILSCLLKNYYYKDIALDYEGQEASYNLRMKEK